MGDTSFTAINFPNLVGGRTIAIRIHVLLHWLYLFAGNEDHESHFVLTRVGLHQNDGRTGER